MKRSKFSLSNYRLFTSEMGYLVPCGMFEVLPGDTVQQATSMLLRVTPLVSPVMHPVQVRVHHWFVPYRILWDKWEDFITGGPDNDFAESFPKMSRTPAVGFLDDYLGLPTDLTAPIAISALPFRAYQTIWNEFYRDQDLEEPAVVSKASFTDTTTSTTLQRCSWEKDYFTSARPWAQKGPDVTLPFGRTAPVIPDPLVPYPIFENPDDAQGTTLEVASGNPSPVWNRGPFTGSGIANWLTPGLVADLSSATPVTVNELREAFALQRYSEARARYGSRYTEYLRFLGVRSSDARLQRPEYLGGGKQTIQFSEVLQTGPDADDAGVAALKGHGIGAMRSNRYRRFFEEHGLVMSLMSVRPKTMYMQGVPRMWTRTTKEDFWQKELEHIGQQQVLNLEVYGKHSVPFSVFGYQDRYDEYRRQESQICGEFRSTLKHWHMAREFAADPVLNASFVGCTPTKRVYQEQTAHPLWIMANHSIQARRLVAQSGRSFIF